ncbi:hypothetical protein PENSTE_c001G03627 [Penicillium steckii]|uniref:Protein disulfide-isomerase n=1 Tax=Penicillium steckii TaxID=303698 RepID=A0A1V6U013_9EURO|nr:hypothetical protein PENSTE_c001G03627 [Penicillium steckii]
MRSFIPIILSLVTVATAGLVTTEKPEEPAVISLTEDTFYDFMERHPLVLANFYAPWCGYSRRLAPKYEAAAKVLKEDEIPLVKVDCTVEEGLCEAFFIRAYPTLKVFRGPWEDEPYGGTRHPESIISYMLEESMDTETGDDFFYQSPTA